MRTGRLMCLFLVGSALSDFAPADDNFHTRISFVVPTPPALTQDVAMLLRLADRESQLPHLLEHLELIGAGTDETRRIRLDVLWPNPPFGWQMWVPYTNKDDLLTTVDANLGFPLEEPGRPDLFQIQEEVENGWLRVGEQPRFGVLVLGQSEQSDTCRRIAEQAGEPFPRTFPAPERHVTAAVRIENSLQDTAACRKRRSLLAELHTRQRQQLHRRPNETQSAGALRIGTRELERFFAECSSVNIHGRLNRDTATMQLDVSGEAIANTSLAASLAACGQNADVFAGVTPLPDSVLSGRLNHPLDTQRQEHAHRWLTLLTSAIHEHVDSSASLQKSEKHATKQICDSLMAWCRSGIDSGNMNAFVEAQHDGRQFSVVAAVSVPKSEQLQETLRLLPSARTGNTVRKVNGPFGDASVYQVSLASGFAEDLDRILGTDRNYLLGFTQDQVWFATGPEARRILKNKLQETGPPSRSNRTLSLDIRMGPWARRFYELAQKTAVPNGAKARTDWREQLLRWKHLTTYLNADDKLHLHTDVVQGRLTGVAQTQSGLLRFLGWQIARYTEQTFE